MEVSDVQSLFAYNEWANARIFSSAAELEKGELTAGRGSSFSSIRDTLSHIATSEWVWLRRWRGESPPGPPEWGSLMEAGGLRDELGRVERHRAEFFAALSDTDLLRPFSYRNLKGEAFTQPLLDSLVHVVNHSTYHRGQIATMYRQAGHAAPATDLIVFKREKG